MTNSIQLSGTDEPDLVDEFDLETEIPGYHDLHCDQLAKSFYHDERLRFFLFITGVFVVFGMVTTSGAFSRFVEPNSWLQATLGMVSILFQAVGYAFGMNSGAAFHRQKKEKYGLLLGELREATTREQVRKIDKDANKESATDSVAYWALEVLSWNRAYLSNTPADATDQKQLYPVTWWERRWRNLRAYNLEHFRERKIENVKRLKQIEEHETAVRH